MLGWQLTFYTREDRKHGSGSLAEWLMQLARDLGFGGATVLAAGQGLGRDQRLHSARFFELGDQPVLVQMALSENEAARLFAAIEAEGLHIFYVKIPIEFGVTEQADQETQA